MDRIKLLDRLKDVCSSIKVEYEKEKNAYQAVRYTNLLQSIDKEIEYEKRCREKRTKQAGNSERGVQDMGSDAGD